MWFASSLKSRPWYHRLFGFVHEGPCFAEAEEKYDRRAMGGVEAGYVDPDKA